MAGIRLPLPEVRKKKKLFTNPTIPFLQIPEEVEKKSEERQDKKENIIGNLEKKIPEKKSGEKKHERNEKQSQEKNEKNGKKKKDMEQTKQKIAKTYSFSEDKAILDYIVTNSVYRLTKGDMIWKQMEQQGLCPNRSWKGMKARFVGCLVPQLALYGLSEELLLASDRKIGDKPVIVQPDIIREQKEMKMYTTDEDMAIIMYIIKNQRFKNMMGEKLWKLMEERQVVLDRSWSSMKSRFKKFIIKNITNYSLEESDLEKFRAVRK